MAMKRRLEKRLKNAVFKRGIVYYYKNMDFYLWI
jgi:hypothetical protein